MNIQDMIEKVRKQKGDEFAKILEEQLFDSEETTKVLEDEIWELVKSKVKSVLKEYKEHYYPKDRGLEITLRITKPYYGDVHREVFSYEKDKIKIVEEIEIGKSI